LFLPSASISGATNETENTSSIGGGRQSTPRGRGRGRASGRGRSRTACSMVWPLNVWFQFGRYVIVTQYFMLFWICNDIYVRDYEYVGQVC
jgi:hypothetical protein